MRHADHSLWLAALPTNHLTNNCWVWRARWFSLLKRRRPELQFQNPIKKLNTVAWSCISVEDEPGTSKPIPSGRLCPMTDTWVWPLSSIFTHTNTDVCTHICTTTHKEKEKKHCQKAGMVTYACNTTLKSQSLSVSQKLKVQPELQETLSELPYTWTAAIRKWSSFLKLVLKNGILLRSSTLSLNFRLHSKT